MDAALREDHIAVAIRIRHAAFVGKHGSEFAGRIENIRKLLGDPPGVFPPVAIIVVAAAHPVQCRSVQDVAPLIEERTVILPVEIEISLWRWNSPRAIRRFLSGPPRYSWNACIAAVRAAVKWSSRGLPRGAPL